MNRLHLQSRFLPWSSVLLVPLIGVLAGCPTPLKNGYPYTSNGSVPPSVFLHATPSPTPSPEMASVSGTVYYQSTGMPVPTAIVFLEGKLTTFADLEGRFTGPYPVKEGNPTVTVSKSGHPDVTVYDYAGGPLAIPGPAPSEAPSAPRVLHVSAPAGGATEALVSVSVKREGYAFANVEAFEHLVFSEGGTASVEVDLPPGEATMVAYGLDDEIVGTYQGEVEDALSLTLQAAPGYTLFQTQSPSVEAGSVGYYLTWPSDSPVRENRVLLTLLSEKSSDASWVLPPVERFGIPGASYMIVAEATTPDGSELLARREIRNVKPGARTLSFLPEAEWKNYGTGSVKYEIPFQVHPEKAAPGANTWVLDVFGVDQETQALTNHAWRVIAPQVGTESVKVPLLSIGGSLGGLKPETKYVVQLHSALNAGRFYASETALTLGGRYLVTYNKAQTTASFTRSFSGAARAGELRAVSFERSPAEGQDERRLRRILERAKRTLRAVRG